MNLRFSGAYQVRVLRPDGSVRLETDFFDNLITDQGLNVYGAIGTAGRLWVTTGTTPPSNTDTALSGTILGSSPAGALTNSVQYATLPNYAEQTMTFTFAVGGVVGTITEVGLGAGTDSTVTTLFSRALIANSGGTPISITLTATDQLQLVYKIRNYIPDADVIASMDVNGVSTQLTVRPSEIDDASAWWAYPAGMSFSDASTRAYTGAIGARTATPAGTGIAISSSVYAAYVAGTYARSFSLIWLPAKGAFTALSVRIFQNAAYNPIGCWQIGLSPSIVKTSLQTLRIEGQFSWGRYVP